MSESSKTLRRPGMRSRRGGVTIVDMKRDVTFPSGPIQIAGHLHLPPGFDESRAYSAVVCVHPGSSVKEQTAGLYAARLAERGLVTLAFDASHWGESGGEPRFLEDPPTRIEDIRCAVDFFTTLSFVDPSRVGVLGICAGGGYAVAAAMIEKRIRAVGTVVTPNGGRVFRARGAGDALRAVAEQRTRTARGEPPLVTTWIPNSPEELARSGEGERDTSEAVDYYRTPRGHHPRSSNQLSFESMARMIAFDPFHLVEELLDQPLQVVVGDVRGEFGSYDAGHELHLRAPGPKDLLVVHGASHYDLYDRPEYVSQAVDRLGAFYTEHLSG